MPATLGMRGTGAFSADERPKNWREMILYLFPNGEAPLTAILSQLKSQGTSDPEYNWFDKMLPTQRMQLTVTATTGDTALTVASGAKDCVAGTILLHEATGELLKVSADPTLDTALPTLVRSFGAVAAGTLGAPTYLVVIGNVHEEGAGTPTARAYAPTKRNNYTEIFRTSLSLTRTAKKTRLRTDNTGPYREAKREALSLHSIEMEKAFIWGEAVEGTGAGGHPERMTGGILSFLSTNKGGSFDVGGPVDEDVFDSLMEEIFRYGSNEKLCLAGSTFIRAITTLGKRNGTIQMTPSSQTYGMHIVSYLTPFGTLQIKSHPLFSQHPEWRKNGLILDTSNLLYRYIDDTMFIRNRQAPGDDRSLDEFLTEAGLELHFEQTHGYITGVTGAVGA